LQPKSVKCIFVGDSEYVKGYRLLQPHCNEIIVRREVKFDENILACEPNSESVPSLACKSYSMFVPSYVPILVSSSSSDDDSEDENPPLHAHLPLDESIEPEPTPTPSLPRWVCSTNKQLVILSVILHTNVRHVHNSSEPLLFWLKLQRLVI
jgi:hypothetical protein